MTRSTSLFGALALVATTATLAFQSASEPAKSAPEYFVTAEGDHAHLWVREGATLRVVGHGACKDCAPGDAHEHKEGEVHDH